jgi:hypothetical protein
VALCNDGYEKHHLYFRLLLHGSPLIANLIN